MTSTIDNPPDTRPPVGTYVSFRARGSTITARVTLRPAGTDSMTVTEDKTEISTVIWPGWPGYEVIGVMPDPRYVARR